MARANGVREIWAGGKAVVNSWLGVPSSFSAEVMAHAGKGERISISFNYS